MARTTLRGTQIVYQFCINECLPRMMADLSAESTIGRSDRKEISWAVSWAGSFAGRTKKV
jgi:hypothetical protein